MYHIGESDPLDKVVMVDMPRNQKNAGIYVTIESIKNGMIKHTKYKGVDKKRPYDAHVFVFSNELPDMTAWSFDRYNIYTILSDKTMIKWDETRLKQLLLKQYP